MFGSYVFFSGMLAVWRFWRFFKSIYVHYSKVRKDAHLVSISADSFEIWYVNWSKNVLCFDGQTKRSKEDFFPCSLDAK